MWRRRQIISTREEDHDALRWGRNGSLIDRRYLLAYMIGQNVAAARTIIREERRGGARVSGDRRHKRFSIPDGRYHKQWAILDRSVAND